MLLDWTPLHKKQSGTFGGTIVMVPGTTTILPLPFLEGIFFGTAHSQIPGVSDKTRFYVNDINAIKIIKNVKFPFLLFQIKTETNQLGIIRNTCSFSRNKLFFFVQKSTSK